MKQLGGMDASFLYFEKKECPMHIGSVSLFEGEISFDKFVENVNSKMHMLPRYQQVVTPDPFNLGHPTWEHDIDNHQYSLRGRINENVSRLVRIAMVRKLKHLVSDA